MRKSVGFTSKSRLARAETVARFTPPFQVSLAFIVDGDCVLRYDNEAGKGDHRHIGQAEKRYKFTNPEIRLTEFWNDVDRWRR
jgi:hypothetical protein